MKKLATMLTVATLALLPSVATAQRIGSWEFGISTGAMYLDGHLAGVLRGNGFNDTDRLMPTFGGRIGANVSDHVGIAVGTMWSSTLDVDWDGVGTGTRYLSPYVNATYTPWLSGFSPYVTGGAQFTRVSGEYGRARSLTHSTWGSNAGLGFRIMLDKHWALKTQATLAMEHYAEPANNGRRTMYSPSATAGLSYFTKGKKVVDTVKINVPVAYYPRARVDTVYITRVRTDTLITHDTVYVAPKPKIRKPYVRKARPVCITK